MKANWAIIPDIKRIDASLALAEKFGAAFEYNDFFEPTVYEDSNEVKQRIQVYRSLPSFGAKNTLHGAFYDVTATSFDTTFRNHSRYLMEQSMEIANELSCKGVVFHSGLIGSLELDHYIRPWISEMSKYLCELSEKNPGMDIYMENTFERNPAAFLGLMEACKGATNIKLCLDYPHAILTPVSVSEWASAFKPYIGHIHLNDNDLKQDMHCPPGQGAIDFTEFKDLLGEICSKVNVLIEVSGVEQQEAGLEYLDAL